MSLVMLSEVRALVETGLTDADLQAVLDREEGWLASRIGALTGERTETFRPTLPDAPIYLPAAHRRRRRHGQRGARACG